MMWYFSLTTFWGNILAHSPWVFILIERAWEWKEEKSLYTVLTSDHIRYIAVYTTLILGNLFGFIKVGNVTKTSWPRAPIKIFP